MVLQVPFRKKNGKILGFSQLTVKKQQPLRASIKRSIKNLVKIKSIYHPSYHQFIKSTGTKKNLEIQKWFPLKIFVNIRK